MPKDFDKFVDRLQRDLLREEIRDHDEKIVNLFHNPINWGNPPNEDITVFEEWRGGPNGYFLGLYLKIKKNKIIKNKFVTDGCGVMVATGSQTTILIKDNPKDFSKNLKSEDIDKALNGLPEDEKHWVDFVIETLKDIIKKYKQKQ